MVRGEGFCLRIARASALAPPRTCPRLVHTKVLTVLVSKAYYSSANTQEVLSPSRKRFKDDPNVVVSAYYQYGNNSETRMVFKNE